MRSGKELMQNSVVSGFANRLNFTMFIEGLSGADLSKQTGIATGTISGYRNGRSIPNIEVAALIAKTLDVSLDWLCGLVDE